MGSKDSQKRINEEVDRLSSLPNDLIHKIFSTISTKDVVQTCVLSSKWRFLWTSIPYFNISSEDFSTLFHFSVFVTHFLSRHNNEIAASSVKIILHHEFLRCIDRDASYPRTLFKFQGFQSPSYLSVPSLQNPGGKSIWEVPSLQNPVGKSIWEVPALTTLYLCFFHLSNDDVNSLFSNCANLKNLTLGRCQQMCSEKLSICHPRLSNLTLHDMEMSVNVVAPKLEKLTITNCCTRNMKYFIEIYAPDLTSFAYKGLYKNSVRLSAEGFTSLKEADIYLFKPNYGHILSLLKHIHNVKFLTLNMDFFEGLSSCMEQILHQPFVFTNLKRLKIHLQSGFDKSIYLNSYPGATLEEIVAQSLVLEFSVLLEQEKTMTRVERGKGPMENHGTKMHGQGKSQAETKLKIGESVAEKIDLYLKLIRVQIEQKKSRCHLIISKLQKIEEVLEKLPASKTTLIQPSLASLHAEAVIVMGEITYLMKTQYDENESQVSGCIQELATAWKSSY